MATRGTTGLWVLAVALVCACGVETPEQLHATDTAESALNPKAVARLMPNACRTLSFRPTATGTVRSAPDVGMLQLAPVGTEVQSMYFDTKTLGPEIRRGVAEFEVPANAGRIVSAQVVFTDQHGWQAQAVPSLTHQVYVYDTSDGAITADDFAREAQPFATVTTDLNNASAITHALDVTGHVAFGHGVGFRLELDRSSISTSSFGSAFADFHVDVKVCDEATLHGALGDPSGVR